MHRSRYIFLSAVARRKPYGEPQSDGVVWLLVSPNNRQLGRGYLAYPSYQECRESVHELRAGHARVSALEYTDERTGQWLWRVDLDGAPVAVSSRSYLRARECHYNLERFLAAVPEADLADGTRAVHLIGLIRPAGGGGGNGDPAAAVSS